jgi:hypothetical protein
MQQQQGMVTRQGMQEQQGRATGQMKKQEQQALLLPSGHGVQP